MLSKFDWDAFEYPTSMDLATFGLGLSKRCVQADHYTLDVFAHEGWLRDDINYIHRSGLRLVDVLFDERILPRECLKYRRDFLGLVERERARSRTIAPAGTRYLGAAIVGLFPPCRHPFFTFEACDGFSAALYIRH